MQFKLFSNIIFNVAIASSFGILTHFTKNYKTRQNIINFHDEGFVRVATSLS